MRFPPGTGRKADGLRVARYSGLRRRNRTAGAWSSRFTHTALTTVVVVAAHRARGPKQARQTLPLVEQPLLLASIARHLRQLAVRHARLLSESGNAVSHRGVYPALDNGCGPRALVGALGFRAVAWHTHRAEHGLLHCVTQAHSLDGALRQSSLSNREWRLTTTSNAGYPGSVKTR